MLRIGYEKSFGELHFATNVKKSCLLKLIIEFGIGFYYVG